MIYRKYFNQQNLILLCFTLYALPLHTTAFFGSGTGFYATDEMIMVTVEDAYPDTIPPAKIIDLGVMD